MLSEVFREMLVDKLKKLEKGRKLNISSLNFTGEQLTELLFIKCPNNSTKTLAPELVPLLSKIDFSGIDLVNYDNKELSKILEKFQQNQSKLNTETNYSHPKIYQKTKKTFSKS